MSNHQRLKSACGRLLSYAAGSRPGLPETVKTAYRSPVIPFGSADALHPKVSFSTSTYPLITENWVSLPEKPCLHFSKFLIGEDSLFMKHCELGEFVSFGSRWLRRT